MSVPLHQCDHVGCTQLVPLTQHYCKQHRPAPRQHYERNFSSQEREAIQGRYRKLYNSVQWKHLSRQYRMAHPFCEHCLGRGIYTPVSVVDHIKPLRIDWADRYNTDNLQSLCASCHKAKTDADKLRYHLKGWHEIAANKHR